VRRNDGWNGEAVVESDQELRLPGVGKGGRATNLGIGRRGPSPEVVFQVLLACELSTANPTGAWDPSPAAAFGRDMRFANLGWHTTGLMRRRVNWVTTQAGRSPGSALLPALVRRPTTPPLPLLEPAVASQQGPRAATGVCALQGSNARWAGYRSSRWQTPRDCRLCFAAFVVCPRVAMGHTNAGDWDEQAGPSQVPRREKHPGEIVWTQKKIKIDLGLVCLCPESRNGVVSAGGVDVGCSTALSVGRRRVSDCQKTKGLRALRECHEDRIQIARVLKKAGMSGPSGQPTDHASLIRCRPLRVKWDKTCGMAGIVFCFTASSTAQLWWAFECFCCFHSPFNCGISPKLNLDGSLFVLIAFYR
jgi:hypothetical protein